MDTSADATATVQIPSEFTTAVLPPASVVPLSNVSVTVAPASPLPVILKPAVVSALLAVSSTATASMVGAAITVSIVKLVVVAAAVWGFPAASVCATETATEPSPSVSTSADVRVIGWAEPVPVTVFVSAPDCPVSVATIVAPLSPLTVITPSDAVASASVAPFETPAPRTTVGVAGAVVSMDKSRAELLALGFSATSTCAAVNVSEPSPMAATSAAVTATDHLPSAPTTAVLPPASDAPLAKVSATVAPTSPVPVMLNPVVASAEFTASSPRTASTVGAATVTSVVILKLGAAALLFPTASACVTVRMVLPSANRSTLVPWFSTMDQLPSPATVAVLAPVNKPLTVTVAPASPVPDRVRPSACSNWTLFTSLPELNSDTVGASGALVSIVIAAEVLAAPRFPALSE